MICLVARISAKDKPCPGAECAGWDHDKSECSVRAFFRTFELLQIAAMQAQATARRIEERMDEEEDGEGDDQADPE